MGLRPLTGDRPLMGPWGDLPRTGDWSLLLLKSPLSDDDCRGWKTSGNDNDFNWSVYKRIKAKSSFAHTENATLQWSVMLHLNGTRYRFFIFKLDEFCHRMQGHRYNNWQNLNAGNINIIKLNELAARKLKLTNNFPIFFKVRCYGVLELLLIGVWWKVFHANSTFQSTGIERVNVIRWIFHH